MVDAALKHHTPDEQPVGPALLASHRMPLPATFAFDCYGTRFDVGIRRSTSGGAEMVIRGNLGVVPFSAESPAVRNHLHAVIDASRSLPNTDISLDSRQTNVVRGSMSFPTVPSPVIVAAGTAAMTIAVRPVCYLVAKCRQLGGA